MALALDLNWKPSSATHNCMTSGKSSLSFITLICKILIAVPTSDDFENEII